MSSTVNNFVNLKLKELEKVIRQQNDLQFKKDTAIENEINFLRHQMKIQEKKIAENEAQIELLSRDMECKESELMKTYDALLQRDRDLMKLTDELSAKDERLLIAERESKLKSKRIENLRFEMAAYLDKLSQTKKALKKERITMLHSESLYNMVKDVANKRAKEIEFERKEFAERITAAHDYIRDLHELLKKHGVVVGAEEIEADEKECLDEQTENQSQKTPVQLKHLNWTPSVSMTTIYEDDESCDNADDER
jgi:phage-related tail protein